MKPNFRFMARKALSKSQTYLKRETDDDLISAALHLRMTMEALVYERALAYADELGPEQMKVWQPKRLMDRILEIDPQADAAATLSFGRQPSLGEPPETMTLLGTDNVLKLETLKKNYDALGAYLHTPTLTQIEKGKAHNMTKLRNRCEGIVEAVEVVLGSKVWNTSIANTGEIDCMGCDKPMRRRLICGVEVRKIECWACGATYNLTRTDDDRVHFDPRQSGITCISPDCETENFLWENEFFNGMEWDCRGCGTKQRLAYGVSPVVKNEGN